MEASTFNNLDESIWAPAAAWSDAELCRWIWFCVGHGLGLRVATVGKYKDRCFIEKRCDDCSGLRWGLLESPLVRRINSVDGVPFSRLHSLTGYLKIYAENTSSRFYCLVH